MNTEKLVKKVNKIDNRYLWHFSEMTNLTTKATIFIKDNDYNDWMPVSSSKTIDSEEEIILLTDMNVFPNYIEEFVEENNLNPDPDEFNFRHIFGTSNSRDRCYNTPRVWFGQRYLGHIAFSPTSNDLDFSFKPNRKLKREDVGYVLSSHYNETIYDPLADNTPKDDRTKFRPISMARCAESHILEIRNNVPAGIAGIAWLNFAPTAFNPYVPFYANANGTAPEYENTTDAYDPNEAYWLSRTVAALIQPSYNEMKSLLSGLDGFLPTADQLTNHLIHQTDLEAEKLSGQKLIQYLTKANAANAQKVLDLTHKTVGNLVKRELTLSRLSFSINTDRLQS